MQQVASQEDVLLKTAAPNLRALENLKTVRDKFQESADGEIELQSLARSRSRGLGLASVTVINNSPWIAYLFLLYIFSSLSYINVYF